MVESVCVEWEDLGRRGVVERETDEQRDDGESVAASWCWRGITRVEGKSFAGVEFVQGFVRRGFVWKLSF